MSLTKSARDNRTWEGLPLLRQFLSEGFEEEDYRNSLDYRFEERISDLLVIYKICLIHIKNVRIKDEKLVSNFLQELNSLGKEFFQVSESFKEISNEFSTLADNFKNKP
jgi:hypothetical protein